MTNLQRAPKEIEFPGIIQRRELHFAPLRVESTEGQLRGFANVALRLFWETKSFDFEARYCRLWTPKAIGEAAGQARFVVAKLPTTYPMVIAPYLSDERLDELLARQVSGIDFCGNGVVIVPGDWLVFRTGRPNRYRGQVAIRSAFRGDSSLVPRVFLLRPRYVSLRAVREEVAARGGQLVLSTVSKACKSLVELLVVQQTGSRTSAAQQFRLLQADKLLDLLAANAAAPVFEQAIRGKARLGQDVLRERLSRIGNVVRSGVSSVGNYAVMAREAIREYYCTDLDATLLSVGDAFEQTERFADTVLLETTDSTVYFDRRPDLVASPIQVYLELMLGDKRSRETAEQVRKYILATLKTEREP